MAHDADQTQGPDVDSRYWARTRRPLTCLVFVAPLLVAYEIGVAAAGTDVLSRSHLQAFLADIGAAADYLSAMLIAAVLLVWHVAAGDRWRVRPAVLGGMVLEAIALTVPLLVLGLLGHRAAAAGVDANGALVQTALARLGAGIYEEFLFRLVWLALVSLVLHDLLNVSKDIAAIIAVVTSAVAFALYHFTGAEAIDWSQFAFLFLAGGYLAGIYLLRGYGVAVGAHVAYNMILLIADGTGG